MKIDKLSLAPIKQYFGGKQKTCGQLKWHGLSHKFMDEMEEA